MNRISLLLVQLISSRTTFTKLNLIPSHYQDLAGQYRLITLSVNAY